MRLPVITRPSGSTLILGLLALLPLAAVLACGYFAAHYGYYRWDSWAYLGTSHNEFEYNQRWLVPLFFPILRHMPSFMAWLLTVALFGWFGYRFTCDYLAGSPLDDRVFSIGLAAAFIIMPGFYSQLGWPTHALSAVFLLVVMQWLAGRVSRIWLVIIGTPIMYGTHQAFAFLTLLFLIPSYATQSQQSLADNLRDLAKALMIWTVAFALGWGIAEAILRVVFGQVPDLPEFRRPHVADSLASLYDNLLNNFTLLGDRLDMVYSATGVILMLALVGVLLIWRMRTVPSGGRPWIPMLIFSGVLFVSVYLFTAPIGVLLPFRLTLLFGPATLLLGLALLAAIRRPVPALVIVYAFCFYPCMLSVVNNHWYARYTSDLKAAIVEIGPAEGTRVKAVLVTGGEGFTNYKAWPEDFSGMMDVFPRVFEVLYGPGNTIPAFYELRYGKVLWCGEEKIESRPPACTRLDKAPPYSRCAKLNPEICSAGVTEDGYWLMRF